MIYDFCICSYRSCTGSSLSAASLKEPRPTRMQLINTPEPSESCLCNFICPLHMTQEHWLCEEAGSQSRRRPAVAEAVCWSHTSRCACCWLQEQCLDAHHVSERRNKRSINATGCLSGYLQSTRIRSRCLKAGTIICQSTIKSFPW